MKSEGLESALCPAQTRVFVLFEVKDSITCLPYENLSPPRTIEGPSQLLEGYGKQGPKCTRGGGGLKEIQAGSEPDLVGLFD